MGSPRRSTPEEFAEKFWNAVDKSGGEFACWPWTRSCHRNGYGQTSYNRKKLLTHRVAYELTNGAVPQGLSVLHTCDTPPCCNPRHLWSGTTADNLADMSQKGRGRKETRRGEAHPRCKFSNAVVAELRAAYANGEGSHSILSARFGISAGYISLLINRKFRD